MKSFFILLLFIPSTIWGQTYSISIEGYSGSERNKTQLIESLPTIIEYLQDKGISISTNRKAKHLEISVSESGDVSTYFLELSTGFERILYLSANEDSVTTIGSAIRSLILQDRGNQEYGTAPFFIEHFSLRSINTDEVLGYQMPLMPMDIDITASGELIVSCSVIALRLSPKFELLEFIGAEFSKAGNYGFAYKAELTPAGSTLFMSATGNELISFYPASPRPIKTRLNFAVPPLFTIFRDGSIIAVDQTTQKIFNIENRVKKELALQGAHVEYISATATSPADDFWIYDASSSRFVITDREGIVLRSYFPAISSEYLSSMRKFIPTSDGSVIILSYEGLFKLDHKGELVWILDKEQMEPYLSPMAVLEMAVDFNSGYIYLANFSENSIYRFKDTSIQELTQEDTFILNHQNLIQEDPNNTSHHESLAKFYQEAGALGQAEFHWNEILQIDPFNYDALDKIEELKLANLISRSDRLFEYTMQELHNLGPESARTGFSTALKLYEQILSLDPSNQYVLNQRNKLQQDFYSREQRPNSNQFPLQFGRAQLSPIYPSLLFQYTKDPIGSIPITNPYDEEITNLQIQTGIRSYSDFPRDSNVITQLAPGETIEIPLYISFNNKILEIEEDMPVQTQITIQYKVGSENYSQSIANNILIKRHTALTWDDSAKLASFITPNEAVVAHVSHALAGIKENTTGIPNRLYRGMSIFEGLGSFDIKYIEDPQTPITEVFEKKNVVDTVRFARTTLLYKSGDCDDTTVLLSSILESAGIETAIMTSPGHVFMAFNTGDTEVNRWLYESETHAVIINNGMVWIPLETTLLNEGFTKAWIYASNLIQTNKNAIEFIPLKDVRPEFPALPLPSISPTLELPIRQIIQTRLEVQENELISKLYNEKAETLIARIHNTSSRRALRMRNQLGLLHARFNNLIAAKSVFEEILADSPTYSPAYVNIANIHIYNENYHEAQEILEEGKRLMPDSPFITLLLARVLYVQGNTDPAEELYIDLRNSAPELAEANPLQTLTPGRASQTQIQPLWLNEP